MQALILAAGRGVRMAADSHYGGEPKCLLRFGSRSLLERHIALLRACGVEDIHVAVGYRAERVRHALAHLPGGHDVGIVFNPDFDLGSVVTLWRCAALLRAGRDTLLMDADVLCDRRLLERLIGTAHDDALLIDRNFEPGEEPVKVCVSAARIVEFRKRVATGLQFDVCGESIGFFRLCPATCRALAERVREYATDGRKEAPHEEALRELMIDRARPPFGVEDVTGLPWIEIDFPDDARAAETRILPRLQD